MASAQAVAHRFKGARALQVQMDALADKAARAVRVVARPGMDTNEVAKRVVRQVLGQDQDGSLLGTVYSDLFDREQFMRTLAQKLSPHSVAIQLAESITLELEDQR